MDRLVGLLVGPSADLLEDRLVGRLVGRLVDRLVDRMVDRMVGQKEGLMAGRSVDPLEDLCSEEQTESGEAVESLQSLALQLKPIQ